MWVLIPSLLSEAGALTIFLGAIMNRRIAG
jgi:hypothetical protein